MKKIPDGGFGSNYSTFHPFQEEHRPDAQSIPAPADRQSLKSKTFRSRSKSICYQNQSLLRYSKLTAIFDDPHNPENLVQLLQGGMDEKSQSRSGPLAMLALRGVPGAPTGAGEPKAEDYVKHDEIPDDITEATEALTQDSGAEEEDSEEEDEDSVEEEEDSDEEEAKLPTVPMEDFHTMLDAMLASYEKTQGKPIKWRLPYKGKVREMELIPFVMFVKGDTAEHDKHCGSYGVRTGGVQQLCRYCCTKTEDTDKAYIKTKPKTQAMIQRLVDDRDADGLQALSQHAIANAWYKILFGKHNKMGIHGACLAEVLHWIQLGQFKYIREMFFDQTGNNTNLSRGINVISQTVGILLKRQSDRELPRTKFSKGAKTGKLMAHEMTGMMLVMAVVLRSSAGRYELLTQNSGNNTQYFGTTKLIKRWLTLFERFLQWEAWLNLHEIPVYEVQRFRTKVRELMEMQKKVGQRTKGMKFKTFNFHVCLHIGGDILDYGVPNHINTRSNEMHHKDSKSAALKTQRRPELFDKQCADKLHEMAVMELGKLEILGNRKWNYLDTQDPGEKTTDCEMEKPDRLRGKVVFWYLPEKNKYIYKVKSTMQGKHLFRYGEDLVEYLQGILESLGTTKLELYTEYKRQGQIFRATPRHFGRPWHDWVMVDWGDDGGILPAQLQCFLDLRKLTGDYQVNDVPVKAGIYAIAETAHENDDPDEIEMKTTMFTPYIKDSTINPDGSIKRKFYLVDVDAFYSTACILPDVGNEDKRAYLKILPKAEWSETVLSMA